MSLSPTAGPAAVLFDCTAIDTELAELSREIEVVTDLSRKATHEIAHKAADQEGLNKRNNGCLERHRKATERKAALEAAKGQRKSRALILETFFRSIAASPRGYPLLKRGPGRSSPSGVSF